MTDFVLGSLSPRGSRRVIYNSDPSNTTRFLSEPAARPEELREVVRNYAREGAIDTLVQEVYGQGWTKFWRTELCTYDQRPQHQRLVPMMDEGVMPIEVYIAGAATQGSGFARAIGLGLAAGAGVRKVPRGRSGSESRQEWQRQ